MNRPQNVITFLLCGLLVPLVVVSVSVGQNGRSGTRKILTRYEVRDDFEGGGLGQWASYPPAQDVGYEPSISPTSDFDVRGTRALMRIVKPNIAGPQRFGFIKKIRGIVAAESHLRFAYRLNSPTPAVIEVGLAGTDGRRYTTRLNANTNRWATAEFGLGEFRAPKGVGVEAIYIVATVPNANPDFTYRLLLDDFILSAATEANFSLTNPQAELIEPWSTLVAARSYRSGDPIALEARAPAQLARAELRLESQTGQAIAAVTLYDDGTHGDKTARDGVWTNNKLYEIRELDPKGVWLGRLRGSTSDGQSVETVLRLIVRPSGGNHPRLFFSATDRDKLVARSRDPKLAGLWTSLTQSAKTSRASGEITNGGDVFELLDSEYLLPSLLGYFDVLNRARSRISYNALEAYITGNSEARNAAKEALLTVARWKHWEPPWFRAHGQHTYYPAGQLATEVAFGYDLLYDDLSEPERVLIRRALIEKSIIPTFKEYVADNRVMVNTSNWIAHTVGGSLIAAASIANDLNESEREGKFEVYVGGLLRKLEDHMAASYLADGSYGEGISYYEFDAETLGPALVALQRTFGTDYWKQTHVLESYTYPLYTLTWPISGSLDMGDTHPPAGHGIPAFVYHSKDPVVRWYYSQFDRPSISKFLLYDDSVQPHTPKLPTSRIFPVKGNAVFRTGWTPEDMVFLFRAGPNFNHHHADQGSFLLTAFGEILVSEAGWSDYYKDPYYATFFTQAIGHNTVLVGANPESQAIADTPQFKALNEYPHITDSITSEFYDGLRSELASVYQKRLDHYVRSVVFVKPNYFVIFDDLKTNGTPDQFDFLLHLPNRDKIKTDNLTAIYNGEKASLAVRSFPSNVSKLSVNTGRVPYHIFSARTPAETPAQPAYLSFRTVNPSNETQFVTAIVPAKSESASQSLIKQMSELAGENLRGIRVERGVSTDLVMFRVGGDTQRMQQDEWSADAASLVITQKANTLETLAVQRARSLNRRNQVLFSSDFQMSIAANFRSNAVEIVGNTEKSTRVILLIGQNPIRVLLDGKELNSNGFSFNRTDGTISLVIPTGQHSLKIMFS